MARPVSRLRAAAPPATNRDAIRRDAIRRDLGEPPRLDWVPVAAIRVDDNYQRGLQRRRVGQILRDFDWAHFQPVMLAAHEDGTYTVFDGQHRVEAARLHPDIDAVPAAIVTFSRAFEEAGAFLGVNVNRTAISTVEKYHAGIEAGDERMMRICAVLEEAGCEVLPAGTHSPGPNRTAAVSAIERALSRYGDQAVTDALLTLRAAWPRDTKALNGSLIMALARIFRANKEISRERMAAKMMGKDRELLLADALKIKQSLGRDAVHAITLTLVEIYNRGLSKDLILIGEKR